MESTVGRYNGRQRGGYVQGWETGMDAVHPAAIDAEASDEELMRLVAAGHQEALGPLYSRYAPFIFNLAAQSLDRPGAEEIVQEVFLTVWRMAATFCSNSSVMSTTNVGRTKSWR